MAISFGVDFHSRADTGEARCDDGFAMREFALYQNIVADARRQLDQACLQAPVDDDINSFIFVQRTFRQAGDLAIETVAQEHFNERTGSERCLRIRHVDTGIDLDTAARRIDLCVDAGDLGAIAKRFRTDPPDHACGPFHQALGR